VHTIARMVGEGEADARAEALALQVSEQRPFGVAGARQTAGARLPRDSERRPFRVAGARPGWHLAVVGCALVALACAGPRLAGPLVLGATLPLTGADAQVGAAMRRGYERAVDEINRAGGVAIDATRRLPVRFELRDDGGEAARAERLASELLSGDCQALLGTASALRVTVQAAVAEQLRKPLLAAAADGVPGSRAEWTFAVSATGDIEARAYETARAALRAFETARGGDPVALRYALLQ